MIADGAPHAIGFHVIQLVNGQRFPSTIPAKSAKDRRRIIEELWEQDPTANLLQVTVYSDGSVDVSTPPRYVA